MKVQNFVKELNDEERIEILNFILDKFDLEKNDETKLFYSALVSYIKTVRRDISSFKKNINEVIDLFSNCGYENSQIINILTKEPSLLHSNKNDIFWRILLLGKVFDTKNNGDVRFGYMIQNPRILRTSQDVMYARIKYLRSDKAKEFLRKDSSPTARQVTKLTHNEFFDSYNISKEELLRLYPFNDKAQLEVVSWPENKELLDNIFGSYKK